MRNKSMLWSLRVVVVGGVLAFANMAAAEETAAKPEVKVDVACLQIPAKLDDAAIKSFMDNPKLLLTDNEGGGLPLSTRVRDLAGSSSYAFDKIMELLKDANGPQRAAIASAFARVVSTCDNIGSEPAENYVAHIQQSIAGFSDPAFASTFQEVSKEIEVASVGPGSTGYSVGGGATGGDAGDVVGSNGYKSPGDGPRDTTSGNYTFGDVNAFGADINNPSPI